jgi:hypothetical protein
MQFALPDELTVGANLRGNEYGWRVNGFAAALAKAPELGYACLGGQFQFRTVDATAEMYWLDTSAGERTTDEPWNEFACRSCKEVLDGFRSLLERTDFRKEASGWKHLESLLKSGWDPMSDLAFVAYMVDELEWQATRNEAEVLKGRSA